MNKIQYYKSAWGDIKHSPGWFGKMCLLALVNLIPVFGQIVQNGYAYGWAREIAWGTHEPMPARIFGNEDGKLYRRGWFILVLTFVAALVAQIILMVGGAMQGETVVSAGGQVHVVGNPALSVLGSLLSLVGIAVSLLLSMIAWIGSMRISIYDRLSAGFQIGKIWKMLRHDTNGILRILGMVVLVGIITGIIFFILTSIFMVVVVLAGIAGMAASGNDLQSIRYLSDAQQAMVVLRVFLSAGLVGLIVALALSFTASLATVFLTVLTARAMGYWTMQFDVPQWRGQDDPMPFEGAQPQPVASVPPYYAGYAGQDGQAGQVGQIGAAPVQQQPYAPAEQPAMSGTQPLQPEAQPFQQPAPAAAWPEQQFGVQDTEPVQPAAQPWQQGEAQAAEATSPIGEAPSAPDRAYPAMGEEPPAVQAADAPAVADAPTVADAPATVEPVADAPAVAEPVAFEPTVAEPAAPVAEAPAMAETAPIPPAEGESGEE